MLDLLSTWMKRAKAERRHSTPDGLRIYAISDVHGCKDQLCQLLDLIDEDRRGSGSLTHLVFLGDLVDRGPRSAGVLDRILHGKLPADEISFVMGNHEEIMLECYDGRTDRYVSWLRFGGMETMQSYGISKETLFSKNFELGETMRRVIPGAHIAFLRSFKNHLTLGDYLFVHAGLRPGVALEDQSARDLRWIGADFLQDNSDHGFKVVHGHTIVPQVRNFRNRIAVDTGCYLNGVLSALVLEGENTSVIASGEKSSLAA
jgi:serine/threonine protein phosphatase 1